MESELDIKNNMKKHYDYKTHHDERFKNMGFSTRCIHMGQEPDMLTGSVNVPIQLSTTYAQTSPGNPFGSFDYSRCGNPTREHLERLVAGLEGGKHALIWSSGMGATTGIAQMLRTGDEIVCIDDVYGGTQRYFRKVAAVNMGIVFKPIDFDDHTAFKNALTDKTKLVWMESPTNPKLKTPDIREIVRITREFNPDIIIVIDNTFMSPYNCRPLDFGVDIVVESATKYIGGHSDLVMGISVTNNIAIHDKLYFIHKSIGAVPSPFDCYMAIRGLKTLSIRVERQNSNALQIAKFLEKHPKVTQVFYPGLESSTYHRVAKSQQKGFGAVVSFEIQGGIEESKKFLSELQIFILAESLGSVESLAEHPALMTHFSVPPEIRKELGITDGFLRLSIGIEEVEDLIGDLDNALNKV
jgi:cystathionine gamma-lyase